MRKKTVSVIIPARNEEGCIGKVIREIPHNLVSEIIVVDGHSTDATVAEAKLEGATIIHQKGYGYGSAVQQGAMKAHGDVFILMDADGSHNPKLIPKLLRKIDEGYEYVMASRYAKGGRSFDDTFIRWLGNKTFTWLTNVMHRTNVSDSIYTFNAISRPAFFKIRATSDGFEYCIELLVGAKKAGLTMSEIPAIERRRFSGTSKVNAFWHGLKILKMILKKYEHKS